MKAYVWIFPPTGTEYVAFANSMKEAKAWMRKHYSDKNLDSVLFKRPAKIRKMPMGFCFLDPYRTVWMYAKPTS